MTEIDNKKRPKIINPVSKFNEGINKYSKIILPNSTQGFIK